MEQYQKLISQYKNLSEEKRNAILLYKSKLSYCINEISSVENFESLEPIEILNKIKNISEFLDIFEENKLVVYDSINIFMRLSIYKDINFENEIKFIESLRNIYFKLVNQNESIITAEDLTLYRAIPLDENVKFISKGELISTSLDIDVCEEFVKFSKKIIIYQITIPKGSSILICPYEIKSSISLDSVKLTLTTIPTQQEVILIKSNFDFEVTSEEEMNLENDEKVKIVKINSKQINGTYKYKI